MWAAQAQCDDGAGWVTRLLPAPDVVDGTSVVAVVVLLSRGASPEVRGIGC